jgi:alcohol dehydrogenase class IV
MGGLLNVIHAEGLAAIYIPFMKFTYPSAQAKFANIAKAMGVAAAGRSTSELAAASVDAVHALLSRLHMRPTLTQLGVKAENIDWLTNNALTTMKVVLSNNPKVPTEQEIRDLYASCL